MGGITIGKLQDSVFPAKRSELLTSDDESQARFFTISLVVDGETWIGNAFLNNQEETVSFLEENTNRDVALFFWASFRSKHRKLPEVYVEGIHVGACHDLQKQKSS